MQRISDAKRVKALGRKENLSVQNRKEDGENMNVCMVSDVTYGYEAQASESP